MGGPEPTSRTEEDRVVSRRVDNPTTATEEDEHSYAAADPLPSSDPVDSYRGPTGGIADQDGAPDDGSEPTRSE